MKNLCEYCGGTIANKKNKMFCDKECMVAYMQLVDCMVCQKKYEKIDDRKFYCSEECENKSNFHMNRNNLETVLGIHRLGEWLSTRLIFLSYKVENKESGEISEYFIDFKKIEEEFNGV